MKEGSRQWLNLVPGLSLASVAERAGAEIVQGTKDRFPDQKAGYERIFVPMDRDWQRWRRWYLQCFSRQLRIGGGLHVVCPTAGIPSALKLKSKARQTLKKIRWQLACFRFARRVIPHLLPRSLEDAARSWGLEIDDLSDGGSGYPRSLRFRKLENDEGSLPNHRGESNDEAFLSHFGSWIAGSSGPPSLQGVRLADPRSLVGEVGRATVLVLSPHPDDELIGCGGTLLNLQKNGWKVHVIQMTEGATCKALRDENENLSKKIRWEEAKAVSAQFDFKTHYWATGSDGALSSSSETHMKLRALLSELQPKLIFVPSFADRHPEHRLTREILETVSDGIPTACRVFEYPVWGFLPEPSHAVEVTNTYPEVLEGLYLYPTALKAEDYVTRCRVLASYYGKLLLGDSKRQVELFSESIPNTYRRDGVTKLLKYK